MSQHDYVINNDSGASVRADINSALQAILSTNSGTSAPTSTSAGTFWLDTTGGAPYTLKIRDAGNNHWLTLGSVTDPGADGNLELLPGKINLPSSGGIYESDGSTEILTESSGAVTLKNTTIDSSVSIPDLAGSWKLLNRTAISGSPTYVEFINGTGGVVIDNSTYERYQFILSGIGCTVDICNVSINAGISSGYITANNYRVAGQESASGGGHTNRNSNSFNHLPLGWAGTSNGGDERPFLSTLDMDLKTNHFPVFRFTSSQFQDNNNYFYSFGGGVIIGSDYHGDHIDRVRFFYHQNYTSSSSSAAQTWQNEGSIALYGLKTS